MKTKTAVLNGKPDAGNPHVRFDEGGVASEKTMRGSLLYSARIAFFVTFAVIAPCALAFEAFVGGLEVGPVKVSCRDEGGWTFVTKGERIAKGIAEVAVELSRESESVPPTFSVSFDVPQRDAYHKWTSQAERVTIPPNWGCTVDSRLCSSLPLAAFLNDNDERGKG